MDFTNYLDENYQERVANGYKKDYKQYVEFLDIHNKRMTEVKKSDIGEYILWLRANGIKETTINKKLSLVRKFYKYLRIERVMLENPFEEVTQIKIYKEEKNIEDKDKNEIIKRAETPRDRIILKMLINEKIKPSEMIKLKMEDIDTTKQMAIIGNKAIVISEDMVNEIKSVPKEQNEHILTNQHGKPLKESGIYFILNKYLKNTGENIKPHDLLKL